MDQADAKSPQPGDTPSNDEPDPGAKDDGAKKHKKKHHKHKRMGKKKTELVVEPAGTASNTRTSTYQRRVSMAFPPSVTIPPTEVSMSPTSSKTTPESEHGAVVTPGRPSELMPSAVKVSREKSARKLSLGAARKPRADKTPGSSNVADASTSLTKEPLRSASGTAQDDQLALKSIATDTSPGYLLEGDVDLTLWAATSYPETEVMLKEYASRNNFHWIIYTILHCLAGSIVSILTKRLKVVPKGKIAFYIALSLLVNSMPGAFAVDRPFGPLRVQPIVFLRGFFAVSAAMFKAMALVFLHVSDVVAIATLVPIGVSIGSGIVLQEKIYKLQWVAMALNIFGVILIIQPAALYGRREYELNHLTGVLFAFGSVLSTVQLMLVVRYMRTMTALKLGFNGCCSRVALSFAVTMLTGSYRELFVGRFMGTLVMLSDVNFVSLAFLGRALSQETAAVVTTLKQCFDIVLSILMESMFLNDYPDAWGFAGSAVILFASFLVGFDTISRTHNWNIASGTRKPDENAMFTEL